MVGDANYRRSLATAPGNRLIFTVIAFGFAPFLVLLAQDRARSAAVPWVIQPVTGLSIYRYYGYGPNLVLDASGAPQIMYIDPTNGVSYAALRGGTWSVQKVYPAAQGPNSGGLALDRQGNANCLFTDNLYHLDFATKNGSAWSIQGIGRGDAGAMLFDAAGQPHLTFNANSEVNYATRTGSTWISESVTRPLINSQTAGELAIEASGQPHVLYYDNGHFNYATKAGNSWSTQQVPTSSVQIGGNSCALALNLSDEPCFAYSDFDDIYFVEYDGSSWQSQLVAAVSDHGYGTSLSLAIAPNGEPAISYFDYGNAFLGYAVRVGSMWQVQDVCHEGGGQGFAAGTSLAFDAGGTPHIAFANGALNQLDYATPAPEPGTFVLYAAGIGSFFLYASFRRRT